MGCDVSLTEAMQYTDHHLVEAATHPEEYV